MAASAESRKRFASPFVNDDLFRDLAKRGRYTALCPEQALDVLRGIFPEASPRDLEACFAASGGDIHATVQVYRREQQALASRLAQGGAEECAGVRLEQTADASDARNRAPSTLGLVKNEPGSEPSDAARLREGNAALSEEAAMLSERAAAAAEQDNAVLKRDVLALQEDVNGELFAALGKKNKECRALKATLQEKHAIIARLQLEQQKNEELIARYKDILAGCEDLQALENECSDLAKQVCEMKLQHENDLKIWEESAALEVKRLNEELNKAKEQHINDAEAIRLVQETLNSHMYKVKAIHDEIIVPAGFGDETNTVTSVSWILRARELISKFFFLSAKS